MARSIQQLNYASFAGGIITEASPLTFPDGASIAENNFELTKQGFRRRRLGLSAISKEVLLGSSVSKPSDIVTFLWDNNGNTGQEFLAVAVRNELLLYDVTEDAPGDNLVYRTTIQGGTALSLTSHAGQLIIANGNTDLTIISSLDDGVFSERRDRLKIRDIIGIPDYSRALDLDRRISLLNAANAAYRPTNNELYLDPGYPAGILDIPLPPTPPQEVRYDFVSVKQISDTVVDGKRTVRHQLTSSIQYSSFQGYPIESFILSQHYGASPEYTLSLIFRDGFYNDTIAAPTLASNVAVLSSGISYVATLTANEYGGFLSLMRSLYLQESNYVNHPHIYNLWNQGWGERRMAPSGSDFLIPPINRFHVESQLLPANADNLNSALYPDAQEASNRTADRFHPKDMEANPQGSSVSPQGRYIIDALSRGESRSKVFEKDLLEKLETARAEKPTLNYEKTTGGATTVAEYAGRVWYAGFSGDTAGSTIKMASKILYGQTDDEDLFSCYQEADPTSNIDSTLVDTDGGWVSIDAIDEVVKLVPTDTALIVFATNGVWAIAGIDGNTFKPTSSMVLKITDKGPLNPQNIVQVDSDIFFWAKDGLYQLKANGYASFELVPMTKLTINSLVLELSEEDFRGMSGAYDERLDRLVWIITGEEGALERRELIYHLAFQSFTINTFYRGEEAGTFTEALSVTRTPQFISSAAGDNVAVGLDNVVAGTDNVIVDASRRDGKPSRIAYVSIRNTPAGTYLFFSDLVKDDFKDWGLVDAPAYLLTGYVTGGDTSRKKSVPYLTIHCNRTEQEATVTGVTSESSCLVQSQWEWTNDAYANKWSPVFQGYRLPRPQIRGVGEQVAQGIVVVTTNNKLRGRGLTVSLKFSTEENKDCQLLGWSMLAGANSNI